MPEALEQWSRWSAWLTSHVPEALASPRSAATVEALDAAERVMGVSLPTAYRHWVARHDGADANGPLEGEILSIAQVVSTWRMLDELRASGTFAIAEEVQAPPGVRRAWWNPRWIPIVGDGAGNHLCIDLDPVSDGMAGQIVEYLNDDGHRAIVASSFDGLFERMLHELQVGSRVVVENRGRYVGMVRADALTGSLATLRIRGEDDATYRARAKATVRRDPSSIAVAVASVLRRYGGLELHPDAQEWMLAVAVSGAVDATTGVPLPLAEALVAPLAARPDVASVTMSVARVAEVVEAFPFVEDVLGPPPAPACRARTEPSRDRSPLEVLCEGLEQEGRPPLAWVVQYASDDALETVWRESDRHRDLLRLAIRVTDRRVIVRAVCACLRALRSNDELRVSGDFDAVELAERWSRGEMTNEGIAAPTQAGGTAGSLRSAIGAASPARAAAAAASAIDFATVFPEERARAARIVRDHVPRPTLPALMAMYP